MGGGDRPRLGSVCKTGVGSTHRRWSGPYRAKDRDPSRGHSGCSAFDKFCIGTRFK